MKISRAASDRFARCDFNRRGAAPRACVPLGLRGGMPNWLREPIRIEAPPSACLVRAGALIVAEIAQLDRKRGLG
jgi:hypothetical protein